MGVLLEEFVGKVEAGGRRGRAGWSMLILLVFVMFVVEFTFPRGVRGDRGRWDRAGAEVFGRRYHSGGLGLGCEIVGGLLAMNGSFG